MATEDQIEGTRSPNALKSGICCSIDSRPQSESSTQLQDLYTLKHDHTTKVRKPYTITKQREKWTEEEHEKFLEALRLYGRGWRQIKEHVGTKTAIQIRSHAQKFFSKVVRESSDGFESAPKSIEIPPPRPKRKPMHPYPPKSVASLKAISISSQPERSPSPNHFVSEQDNKSPSSVLSPFVFGAMGSSASEQPNRCSSPTSCTTNIQSPSTFPVEKETDHVTSTEKENESLPSVKVFGQSAEEDILSLKSNTAFEEPVCAKGNAAAIVVPFSSIKLFGKTVEVKDCGKPSMGADNFQSLTSKNCLEGNDAVDEKLVRASPSMGADNFQSLTSKNCLEGNDAVDEKLVRASPSTYLDIHLSHGTVMDNWSRAPSKSNLSPCMEIHPDKNEHVEYTSDAPLPWWAFYHGLPFYYITPFNQTQNDSCVEERMKEKEILNERSCSGSNTDSVGRTENREKNLDSVDSQCQPDGKMTPQKCKGFVPYKRCLAERDMSSSMLVSEGRERAQKARVCS